MSTASDITIVCPPVGEAKPDKMFPADGELGKGQGCACMWISKFNGQQTMRMKLEKGFDWVKHLKPILPGNPDWCPATHFGYLESGEMKVKTQDGSVSVIKAGQSYHIPPGHLPIIECEEGAVMVEFSQDPTYTKPKEEEAK